MSYNPRISEQNQENLRRLAAMIDASAPAIANYLIKKGSEILEESFNRLDHEVKEAFREALKTTHKKELK